MPWMSYHRHTERVSMEPPPHHHQVGVVYLKTDGRWRERERLEFWGHAWKPGDGLIHIVFVFDVRCDFNAVAITDWSE